LARLSSIYEYLQKIIDVTSTTFYESGDLVHMVQNYLVKEALMILKEELHPEIIIHLKKFLKDLKICINNNNSKRQFKILKLTNTSASNTKLDVDGNEIDIVSYFQKAYNRLLQYPLLPCIVIKVGVFSLMEVCRVIDVCNICKFSLS